MPDQKDTRSEPTIGPWTFNKYGEIHHEDGYFIAEAHSVDPGIAEANAARIVACVNALEGIENPEEFVRAARALVLTHTATDIPEG